MTSQRDWYEVLGVAKDATTDQIRRAFRAKARTLHPDVNDAPDASAKFAEVSEAHEVLGDPELRSVYDRFGHRGVEAKRAGHSPESTSAWGAGGPGGPSGWPAGNAGGFGGFDAASVFEEILRGQSNDAGRRATSTGARPRRGADLEHSITITFMTAARGGSETIRLAPGGGEMQRIDVTIPPAIESGARLRVRGKGSPARGGGPPGDLILTVNVGGHPWFERTGLNLSVVIPVTIAEATFGTTVSVPLLDGTADLRIPPGTASGTRLRLRDKGLENKSGDRGDLFAKIRIVAPDPDSLDEADRADLERIGACLQNPRTEGPWQAKS